ncbi:hypothetical protein AN478_06530 [Thiohalorhabdus denitrificans]|nr:DUF4147 domain-containing protein [Thiohalorhabdus denitrificans]KPV40444.1 hypothetical protein AN478_06530 [Thiohalorhabdus denitrificans]
MRADAEAALSAALATADPARGVAEWLRDHPRAGPGRRVVVAMGKAACAMAAGAVAEGGVDPADVLVITKDGHGARCPEGARFLEAGHPRPDGRSLAAGAAILEWVVGLGARDELLLLVSGGASALADALPPGIPPGDWYAANEALVGAGLPIEAINAVRKHCSQLKGGQLARAAAPARVTALLLSDVIGDDPAVIGSGPAAPDPSTFDDALAALHGLSGIPDSLRAHLEAGRGGHRAETPVELPNSRNVVVGSNRQALESAAEALRERGYGALILTGRLQGEAREVARAVGAVALEAAATAVPAPPPVALLWGGETTVTLGPESGEGGRNQEMALAMGEDLAGTEGVGVLCAGTDGTDGPTDAAGGWVDGTTWDRAREAGWSIRGSLAGHDSGSLLEALGDRVVTGPTGTNVMDLCLALVSPKRPWTQSDSSAN